MPSEGFSPEDLETILKDNGIDGCVVVQSDQSEGVYQIVKYNEDEVVSMFPAGKV